MVGFREQQNMNVRSVFCGIIIAGYRLLSSIYRILPFMSVGQMEVALKSTEITSISSHCRCVQQRVEEQILTTNVFLLFSTLYRQD